MRSLARVSLRRWAVGGLLVIAGGGLLYFLRPTSGASPEEAEE
jgi:hypothetical protein